MYNSSYILTLDSSSLHSFAGIINRSKIKLNLAGSFEKYYFDLRDSLYRIIKVVQIDMEAIVQYIDIPLCIRTKMQDQKKV